jgi:hypothetical protein
VARFTTALLPPPAPKPGVHIARIVRARERTSENGNAMLRMVARFSDLSELDFTITFVPKAAKLISFFCRSCDLELPKDEGIEVEIRPDDVLGRIFYPVVEADGEGLEAIPKITRFLSRAESLAVNPALAELKIQPQAPRTLKALNRGQL